MIVLDIERISKSFLNKIALDDISFTISKGEICGLLGPNGAGKTTLLRLLTQILTPDIGKISINGEQLSKKSLTDIGYLPEERGLYKTMKVGDMSVYFAILRGVPPKEATEVVKGWFQRFEIEDWWGKSIGELSKGMQQKIQFIIAVVNNPSVLILDEPFSGLDPINYQMIEREIIRLRNEGTTIILSTHNMNSVENLCSHAVFINNGKIVLSGSIKEIKNQFSSDIVEMKYIGESDLVKSFITTPSAILSEDTSEEIEKTIRIAFENDSSLKRFLSTAVNSNLDVISFVKVVPPMEDIFINIIKSE